MRGSRKKVVDLGLPALGSLLLRVGGWWSVELSESAVSELDDSQQLQKRWLYIYKIYLLNVESSSDCMPMPCSVCFSFRLGAPLFPILHFWELHSRSSIPNPPFPNLHFHMTGTIYGFVWDKLQSVVIMSIFFEVWIELMALGKILRTTL